jgi:hypothetical protein
MLALADALERACEAADAILAPICAVTGRSLYDWADVPNIVDELVAEEVVLPAKDFRDLYDATDLDVRELVARARAAMLDKRHD